jgi:DNA adenine methylase
MIGGKGVLRRKILPYFPPHQTYVEPFGGGANLLLIKEQADVEVYNDVDPRLVGLFRCIVDPELREQLTWKLTLTPYSRKERLHAMAAALKEPDPVEQARMFFTDSRQSLGGMLDRTSWGLVTNSSVRGMAQPISAYLKTINMLPRIAERMGNVKLYNEDWKKVVALYDSPDTLFYMDPPYPKETRRDGWYDFEMSDGDHEELVEVIQNIQGMVVLSGYHNDEYAKLQESGWKLVEFSRSCNAAARTRHTQLQGDGIIKTFQKRTECIWLNPEAAKSE